MGSKILYKITNLCQPTLQLKFNQKVEGLITYSFDQHISKFKVCNVHKESQETTNSDKLTNLELWGANTDFKSY